MYRRVEVETTRFSFPLCLTSWLMIWHRHFQRKDTLNERVSSTKLSQLSRSSQLCRNFSYDWCVHFYCKHSARSIRFLVNVALIGNAVRFAGVCDGARWFRKAFPEQSYQEFQELLPLRDSFTFRSAVLIYTCVVEVKTTKLHSLYIHNII